MILTCWNILFRKFMKCLVIVLGLSSAKGILSNTFLSQKYIFVGSGHDSCIYEVHTVMINQGFLYGGSLCCQLLNL